MALCDFTLKNPIEEKGLKTIIVSNIPRETSEHTIIIHFQKRKHGGGDVESIQTIGDGVALVTFEKAEGKSPYVTRKPIATVVGAINEAHLHINTPGLSYCDS